MQRRRFCGLVLGSLMTGGLWPAAFAERAAASSPGVLWIIPHTHWEGAVFKTREEYLQIGLPHILQVLDLLSAYPGYRFVLDQMAYVRPFLERYPDQAVSFRQFVNERRLEIVGGTDVMDDVNIPAGESWIRQISFGKKYFRDALGIDVTVGWALDTFGHHAQMPQLLRLAGLQSYWFQRGVPSRHTPSEFLWEGIDGSQIPAFWLAEGYGWFYGAPHGAAAFARFAEQRYAALGAFSQWPDRVALEGVDVSPPEAAEPVLVQRFDREAQAGLHLRFAVPSEFAAVVARRGSRTVVSGELNPVFQGVYSSRIELKQKMRAGETALFLAECLCALAGWLGEPVPHEDLERAWEPLLFNQAHDLMSGTMVDKVYRETLDGDDFSGRLAEELASRALTAIARSIQTRGPGIPVLVLNPLGWERSDYVEVPVGFGEEMRGELTLVDAQGEAVPVQVLETVAGHGGGIVQARLGFVARKVPALGYEVYRVVERRAGSSAAPDVPPEESTGLDDTGVLENEQYRVKVDLWTGAIREVWLRSENWNALSGAGNVVACEHDGGDLWELYGTLNGNRRDAMTREQPVPQRGRDHFSDEAVGGNGRITQGPVFSEFQVSHPFGAGAYSTRVRLYRGLQRIDLRTTIENHQALVRYRVLFPLSVGHGTRTDEIPFGALERPEKRELPAQNWMDYSDGEHGVCLLNRGLPGNNVADGSLLLSLMRSSRIAAYGYIGGYEPGVSSDTGLEMGARLPFDYALLPHTGGWRMAQPWRAGAELNRPLVARALAVQDGPLPSRWGALEISPTNVALSAFKPADQGDAIIVRIYEAAGQAAPEVSLRFHLPVASVRSTSLLEEQDGAEIPMQGDRIEVGLKPFEIRSFLVRLKSGGLRGRTD